MVHLKAVRMRGFKTFAKPTELVLEPGVTVIIGPNGSGKSNIADAVLWVLGEQSPANLRGRSMQDVVFAGADGKRMSSVAEVSLVFDNGCGELPFDCSELEVTRRLSRERGSEYRLNGNACRLLDIQDVVGALGLGREMHSVISQGRVESFLNSSAEARRAMVEEAAGLGRFKKRRARAQAKLERTNHNLARARDIEEEVRAAMRPLKQQVAAAERHAEATEALAAAKARLLLHSLVEAEDAKKMLEAELAGVEKNLGDIGSQVAEIRRQRAVEEESFSAALKERERLGSLYHRARAEAEYLDGRTTTLRQRLARVEGDLDRARRRHELTKSEAASLETRLKGAVSGTADEGRLAKVTEWSEMLRTAADEAVTVYQESARGEDDLKDKVFELETARSKALQDRDFVSRDKEERSRVGAELSSLLVETESRVGELEAQADGLGKIVAEAEEAVLRARGEVKEAVEALKTTRDEAEDASRREAQLVEVLAGLESRQAVLRGVLERKEGLPSGAKELMEGSPDYRCVTDLLTVAPGYERAVAAAFGPLIGAVVVPSSLDLGGVLSRSSGPIEVIKERSDQEETAAEAPTGTVDLWEVVSGPEAVVQALRSLLPDTVIYEESERVDAHMAELAEGGAGRPLRVVSRSGELLEGRQCAARRGEVGAETLLSAANELDGAAREHEEISAESTQVREAAKKAAARIAGAEERSRAQEEGLREAERRLAGLLSERDLCTRRLEEGREQLEELRARNERERLLGEELTVRLRASEEAVASRESGLEEARSSLRVLQAHVEAQRGVVARLQEKKSQAALVEVRLRERCRAATAERMRVKEQKDIADSEVKRCEGRLLFLKEYAPVVADLLAVAEKLAERGRSVATRLETEIEETRAQTEGPAKTLRDRGSAEIGLQREYDAFTARLSEARVEQARLEDKRDQLEGELAELRRRHLAPREVTREEVTGAEAHTLEAAVSKAERRRDRIGPVNPLAEQEYGQLQEREQFLSEQRGDLETAVVRLQEVIAGLDDHIQRTFGEVFDAAKANFSSVIEVVFPKATGTLKLTESAPVLREVVDEGETSIEEALGEDEQQPVAGVDLEVRFANKAPRSLSLLSGGEKAMTAIAFLFSLFLARPCPFYILDEVEASLDDINIRRFLSLIRKYKDRTQFIIITHQRQTMEVADTLYGVALESDGSSRVLSRRMAMAKGA